MFESTGGDFGQWLANLFGSSSGDMTGAANALAQSSPTSTEQFASAMNPALTGVPETSQSLAASSSSGVSGDKLAQAFKTLGGGSLAKGAGNSDSSAARGQNAGLVGSQAAGAGGGLSGLNSLINAMNQRRNLFFVGTGGEGKGGLLG